MSDLPECRRWAYEQLCEKYAGEELLEKAQELADWACFGWHPAPDEAAPTDSNAEIGGRMLPADLLKKTGRIYELDEFAVEMGRATRRIGRRL